MNFLNYCIRILGFSFALSGILLVSCDKESKEMYRGAVVSDFKTETTTIEEGDAVIFENISEGDIPYYSWTFEGGIPSSSTMKDPPPIFYEKEGVYQVRLVVVNYDNKVSTIKQGYITVEKGPSEIKADFTVDKLQIKAGEQITLTDQSTGMPKNWEWEFTTGEGTTLSATDRNPTVQFDMPGIYSVKLKAKNRLFEGEVVKENLIKVLDPYQLEAIFSADQLFTYTGREVKFTDESLGEVSAWNWTFEGGTPSTSTDQNPKVTYANTGRYKVTLKVSNSHNSSTKEVEGMIMVAPGNDLLAFLPFNGNKNDYGPLSLAVTEYPGVAYNGASRYANSLGNTAVFDGNGYLHIPATTAKQLGTSSFSIGIWLKSSSTSLMFPWMEGGTGVAGDPLIYFRLNSNAANAASFMHNNQGSIMNVARPGEVETLIDNKWYYVVCVRDVTSTTKSSKFYVNGTLIKSANITVANDVTNTMGFFIGTENTTTNVQRSKFTGNMSDMVIYKRALTQAEITQLSSFK